MSPSSNESEAERIALLRRELEEHNHRYYTLDQPSISDFEFDQMMRELIDLEARHPELRDANSPSQRVGGEVVKGFETVEHLWPMLSLSNAYSIEELNDFFERIEKAISGFPEVVCELKYDGAAIGLRYRNGHFERALTRGDGQKGDDISSNVRTIGSVPLRLLQGDWPKLFEARGEVYMPRQGFEKMNRERIEQGLEAFANPRNSASGTLKMQDSAEVSKRPLEIFIYQIQSDEAAAPTHWEQLEKAKNWGFRVPPENYRALCRSKQDVLEFIERADGLRATLPFDIDGVVVKVDRLDLRQRLGFTAKSPRWAIAFKFKAEQAITRLEDVVYQIGRTGALTPVGVLQAVQLAGTTVKRASLHNADQIARLDLRIGDWIYVEKGGEIIPKVTGVLVERREARSEPLHYPTQCPECGSLLERQEGEAQHYCPNQKGCFPQILGRIEHFVSRKAMDIEGLGPETLELLVKANRIALPSDLYTLDAQAFSGLERMGDKTISNLLESIERSKERPFERVLFALGIRHVGETVAKKLAQHFGTLERLRLAETEELLEVGEIGSVIAESVRAFFMDREKSGWVDDLVLAGIKTKVEERQAMGTALEGLKIVVSGTFERYGRDEIKELIEQNGGKLLSAVSAKTDALVAGGDMGPAKKKKAVDLGIPIWSEQELEQKLGLGSN